MTVAAIYKARWAVELLFKELKQTLQLQDFFGENQNAVEWQIWAAMLTHLVLRYIKWKHKVACSFADFRENFRTWPILITDDLMLNVYLQITVPIILS